MFDAERRTDPSRPIVFVAHSLGGIVVKEMLRQANGCHQTHSQLYDVFKATAGILFFGTPHGGADPRGLLLRVVERTAKIIGFSVNEQVVNTLLPNSERLRELRDEFAVMAQLQDWKIHSFQEEEGVAALRNAKVVEEESSCLHLPLLEITQRIGRNHMEMCRFTGMNDI